MSYLAQSDLLEHPEAPWALSSAMARARVRRTRAYGSRCQSSSIPDSLSDRERAFAVEVLSRRIERHRQRGDKLGEARSCVNLGNFRRRRDEPLEAIPLYDRALECDSRYAERRHYWEEKAGVLFGAHRYDEAAATYRLALELGAEPFVRALQADALLFAGSYSDARSLWQRFVPQEPIRARAAEYVLKLDLVEDIIGVLGLDEQTRKVPDLTAPLIEGDEPPSPEKAREVALAALRRDALDPRGWQVLAWVALNQGDLAVYVRYLRAVACLLERDVEAWANAVAMNWGVPGGALVPEMLVTGERLTGGELLPALAKFARESIDEAERAGWLAEINELHRSIPPRDEGRFAMRFLAKDGSVSELAVGGAESLEDDG